jgi:hypothetical protein
MTAPNSHVIVLPGGGHATHADHEGLPLAEWIRSFGVVPTRRLKVDGRSDSSASRDRAMSSWLKPEARKEYP